MMNDQLSDLSEKGFRDIAPPPPVWDQSEILLCAAGSLVFLVFTFGLLRWMRLWRGRPRFPRLPGDPGRRAVLELEMLESELDILCCGEVAARASDALRCFLHREHGMLASFETSEELAGESAENQPPVPPGVTPFVACLKELDALRFGRSDVSGQEAREALKDALKLLNSRESHSLSNGKQGAGRGTGKGTGKRPYELPLSQNGGEREGEVAPG